ncbi:patatin-like phospholipase family protein [Ramlibacter sp. MAHUQ-53]|uniref:patatin-like phospholipase family protein n=1 Tax=unclassified Ramlibacter TaxID=2617605 RepID=UPI00363D2EAA
MDADTGPGPKTLNLALQGGGSHGAFTWGVLDALLADRRIAIEGLSGTSAGAVNAVALASGWATAKGDRRVAAREALARLWDEVGSWGALGSLQDRMARALWGGDGAPWGLPNPWAQAVTGLLSPYQTNPLDINPLRDLLQRRIDFTALRRAGVPRVFVSATHVATGKAVIFSGAALTRDAVAASACLPTLFQAVRIGGQAYWDGGYAVNPPLTPLIASGRHDDILVVQINPLRRDGLPDTASRIADRMNELTFNASLLAQMRGIDKINRLIEGGHMVPGHCKSVRLHRVDGGAALLAYTAASKADTDPALIRDLFHIGQDAGRQWLVLHADDIGVRGTVDVAADYEDDTRIDWPSACAPPAEGATVRERGFRPWLGRLLGRGREGGNGQAP